MLLEYFPNFFNLTITNLTSDDLCLTSATSLSSLPFPCHSSIALTYPVAILSSLLSISPVAVIWANLSVHSISLDWGSSHSWLHIGDRRSPTGKCSQQSLDMRTLVFIFIFCIDQISRSPQCRKRDLMAQRLARRAESGGPQFQSPHD